MHRVCIFIYKIIISNAIYIKKIKYININFHTIDSINCLSMISLLTPWKFILSFIISLVINFISRNFKINAPTNNKIPTKLYKKK